MKTLLIVYHSQTGNTEQLAQAVYHGACQVSETHTRLVRAFEATLEDLRTCHGVLFGTPENFGYMSGAIKDFLIAPSILLSPIVSTSPMPYLSVPATMGLARCARLTAS